MALEIATIIRNQIGHKALYMIGAKNIMGDVDYLQFKIMRNSKKITYIKITLVNDLYNIEFFKVNRKYDKIMISEVNGIYADMLESVIGDETGLITKL